ncbi:hypothetical protein V5O48_013087 [Marasmius crinis-equi]|uniref:Uncharacterized protein n=1 Tax=Marasmius crinis-equi TaxID=585013 RepID=A0ABR3F172_9AGAR
MAPFEVIQKPSPLSCSIPHPEPKQSERHFMVAGSQTTGTPFAMPPAGFSASDNFPSYPGFSPKHDELDTHMRLDHGAPITGKPKHPHPQGVRRHYQLGSPIEIQDDSLRSTARKKTGKAHAGSQQPHHSESPAHPPTSNLNGGGNHGGDGDMGRGGGHASRRDEDVIRGEGSGNRMEEHQEENQHPVDEGEDADVSDDESDSGTDDEESPSDKEESDRSRTKEKWLRKGTQAAWTERQQKNQVNRLVRDSIREAFHVKHNYEAYAQPPVPEDRLRRFHEDPKNHGPKVHRTYLDNRGETTSELQALPWNLRLTRMIVKNVMEIASECRDPSQFGAIDKRGWKSCVKERLYRIFLAETKSQPQHPDETMEEVIDRLIAAHKKENARSKKTTIRHTKCEVRAATCAIMLRRVREEGDEFGKQYWAHALEVVSTLGPDGMSDESDAEEVNHRGFTTTRDRVRQVKDLEWRHPSLRDLMMAIDNTPGVEKAIFAQTGRPRIRRVRVEQKDGRAPPRRLYRSFFKAGYLGGLHREHVKRLKVRKATLPLFNIQDWDMES